MLHSRESIEPGSEKSCLRAIVKTGNAEIDRLGEAITHASADDIVLLMLAINRQAQAQTATNTST
jgi:hypothetical protein